MQKEKYKNQNINKNHSRVSLSAVPALFKMKADETPDTNLRGWQYVRAFTLIELLVVVLIIGILAAIALPQYEVAVAKSRFSALMPIVDGYKKALELYYLANGAYPHDTAEDVGFDITAPTNCAYSGTTTSFSCSDGIIYDVLDYGEPNVLGLNTKTGNGYVVWAAVSDHPNERRCLATASNSIANQVCKSFGGIEVSGETYRYAAHPLGTLKVYKL